MLSMISNLVKRYNKWGWRWFFVDFYEYIIKFQYNKYIRGELAMKKLVSDYQFETVLDIGCGNGSASRFFTEHGKVVTACDYGRSVSFKDTMAKDVIIADFNTLDFGDKKYDCIWCSHVLEHQLNVQSFLEKINSLLAEGGYSVLRFLHIKTRLWADMFHGGAGGCYFTDWCLQDLIAQMRRSVDMAIISVQ